MADLPDRSKLERKAERAMSGLSRSQRDRLAELLGDPPDMENVPASFWRNVEEERQQRIAEFALLIWLLSAKQHGATDKEAAAAAGARYAADRSKRLARDFVVVSKDKLAIRAREWEERRRKAATDPAVEPPSKADAEQAADEVFAPSRDESIGITETTQATSAGGEWATKDADKASPEDQWITEADGKVCPVCQPLHEQPRAVWEGKFPDGPPGHPRCRCWIEYAVGAATELATT
ncbi:MAG: hypothetical protein WBC44_01585 [Planctomycetaceae bacterium]